MATKTKNDLSSMSAETLNTELAEIQASLSKMKFDHAVKGLQNPIEISNTRKDVARIKTELRNKEILAMSKEQLANRSRIRLRRK